MKNVTKEMLKIYQPVSNLDWMNYKIVRKSDMTFHHIKKRFNGGKVNHDEPIEYKKYLKECLNWKDLNSIPGEFKELFDKC